MINGDGTANDDRLIEIDYGMRACHDFAGDGADD